MTDLTTFLQDRRATGFTTEDALTSFLPLARQVAAVHELNQVAPLQGIEKLQVNGVEIWFPASETSQPSVNDRVVERMIRSTAREITIESEIQLDSDLDDSTRTATNAYVLDHDEKLMKPCFVVGYVAWEHLLDHHDPVTDVFSLGMILASIACSLDFTNPEHLENFVANRRNLFELNADLHPAIAQSIVRMTELDKHRRPQDLMAIIFSLENYRDQDIEIDIELMRNTEFARKDLQGKQQIVLGKLQERLFEISRRNRLLQFRQTMQSVNLTQASIPLSFDIQNIRADQIFTCTDDIENELASERPVALNKHLNFNEALYLPSSLDRLRSESLRDMKEYGFAQLRIVLAFLRWANLKVTPHEVFESPLVLLPVQLTRSKGVRDTYTVQAIDSFAEINPVIRHQFDTHYDIALPESIDLTKTSLGEFHHYLEALIHQTEPSVTLIKIDKPHIELIHQKAKRRLEQYRKRARLSGRTIKRFCNLDYSYDQSNYHPLGLSLFESKIKVQATHLNELVVGADKEPNGEDQDTENPPAVSASSTASRTFYRLRQGNITNPYGWEFDLCNVTLGNFKYRKMSLVRDYAELIDKPEPHEPFDAVFSLVPRPVDNPQSSVVPLEDRFNVVPCDPTQAAAVATARQGKNYIIQGPPGTGKSQTITNLIADFVAQGKRVLFVCEKRAAIDVVYHRLKQQGLHDLCCLIHDSQADKKLFVMDLKQSYENSLGRHDKVVDRNRNERQSILDSLREELKPLEHFSSCMCEDASQWHTSLRSQLDSLAEKQIHVPTLTPVQWELVPPASQWIIHRSTVQAFMSALNDLAGTPVLAQLPVKLIRATITHESQPVTTLSELLAISFPQLQELISALAMIPLLDHRTDSLDRLDRLGEYLRQATILCHREHRDYMIRDSQAAQKISKAARKRSRLAGKINKLKKKNSGWIERFDESTTKAALSQSRSLETSLLRFLNPTWWRLKKEMKRRYDFSTGSFHPSFVQVLELLEKEWLAVQSLAEWDSETQEELNLNCTLVEFMNSSDNLDEFLKAAAPEVVQFHTDLIRQPDCHSLVEQLTSINASGSRVQLDLARVLVDFEDLSLGSLLEQLQQLQADLDLTADFIPLLKTVIDLPLETSRALRRLDLDPVSLEAAVLHRAWINQCREDRPFRQFSSATLERAASRLDSLCDNWMAVNAGTVLESTRQRFLEHIELCSLPASQLTDHQKKTKKRYNRGRRELEHEFGKSMRYKSIRDLVSDESGDVVRDLKPVWLMSPLSVSDTLPLDPTLIDVVIFDEASQITLEEAVPALFRAKQAIIVGDQMQLPPTNFFAANRTETDDQLTFEEEGEIVEYDLDCNSFLNHAARNLNSQLLGWHYRSRSESLISFSNWAFYQGRLLTVPDEHVESTQRAAISAHSEQDVSENAAELVHRPISFHFIENGIYQKRRNRAEAYYIANLIRTLLMSESGFSIAVVAFSEAQQSEIEDALVELGNEDPKFSQRLDLEWEREEEGQFVGLLVKNLENIQGDERDIVILSVCYGPDDQGKMRMNFGPINKSGGEKRLNVAFSRAKHHMAIVSSIRHPAITNDYNDGANSLKRYLQYAEASSIGDTETVNNLLHSLSPATAESTESTSLDIITSQIGDAIRGHGYEVEADIGQSHFRCDLAVKSTADSRYRLGVLVDSRRYYLQKDLLERDLMKPKLLRAFGWNIIRVLAKDWIDDREHTIARILRAIESSTNQEAAPKPSSP